VMKTAGVSAHEALAAAKEAIAKNAQGQLLLSEVLAAAPPADDICCCYFGEDLYWHCTNAMVPDTLCYMPWPSCCDIPYTICQ
jgi:hypothetical protein